MPLVFFDYFRGPEMQDWLRLLGNGSLDFNFLVETDRIFCVAPTQRESEELLAEETLQQPRGLGA